MAPEQKLKKRKASIPADEVERVKKVKKLASDITTATDAPVAAIPKKSKAPKSKTAEGIVSREPTTTNVTEILTQKPKSSKDVIIAEKKLKNVKGAKEGKTAKLSHVEALESEEKIAFDDADDDSGLENGSDNDEVDDQTEALLKGFESDDDEEAQPEGDYKSGEPIPEISKKLKKQAKQIGESSTSDTPGVVYLGRIPHGFYEHEMRQYFGQFGDILRLRLSRNRKTGRSKHFAFLEFKSGEVAEIVVKTMDNYLLFGHILKCKLVKPEQVHENLWKGANKRFKKVPWNKIQGRKLQQGMTEEDWNKRISKEEARRVAKAEKMKSLGYEFESPALKAAKGVPVKQQDTLALLDVEEPKAIEIPVSTEPADSALLIVNSDKSKKNKKKAGKVATGENIDNALANPAPPAVESNPPIDDVAEEIGGKKKSGKLSRPKKVATEENVVDKVVQPVSKKIEQLALAIEAVDEEKKEVKKPKKRGRTSAASESITLDKAEIEDDTENPTKTKRTRSRSRKSKAVDA